MAKPDKLPRWADTGGAVKTEPDESKKDVGWIFKEKPPFDWFNWLLFYIYDWIRFLYNEMVSPGHNDDGTHKADVIDTAQIVDDAVTAAKINPDVAGNGLDQAGSGALKVNNGDGLEIVGGVLKVKDDDSTLIADGTSLRVKDDGITNAKLANMGALSVKGNPTNGVADPTGIVAGSDGDVLRRSGTALGFGEIATAGIADDAVTAAKINPDVAGNGLVPNGGSGALDLNINSTLNIAADVLGIANGGVNTPQLAADAVTSVKIDDEAVGRRESLELANLLWNPDARKGNAGYYDGGASTEYDVGDDDQYILSHGTPNFTAQPWSSTFASGPQWTIVPASAFKADLSEKFPVGASVNLTLSALITLQGLTAGSVGMDLVLYDSSEQVTGVIAGTTLTSSQARTMNEATGITPAGTTYGRWRKWVDASATATNYIIQFVQITRDTRADLYENTMAGQYLSARYSRNSNQIIANGNRDVIDYDDITFDAPEISPGVGRVTIGANWNFKADRYIKVDVTAKVTCAAGTDEWDLGDTVSLYLYHTPKGGAATLYSQLDFNEGEANTTGSIFIALSGNDGIELHEGDKIDIRLDNQTGVNVLTTTVAAENYVFIREIS